MHFDSKSETLLRNIVFAIGKAVSDDYSDFVRDYSALDTRCGFGHMRINFINTRMKEYVSQTDAFIHNFKRYTWQGRIIIDKESKRTFSITTQTNLNSLIHKKGRRTPHFLQSILAIENKNVENPYEQLALIDTSPFEHKVLEDDYYSIMASDADEYKDFTHYVIAYLVSNNGLVDVDLILLDSRYVEIEMESLNEFITLDYGKLTETIVAKSASDTKSTRSLVSLKKGISLNLIEADKAE